MNTLYTPASQDRLVQGEKLLELLFDEATRPSPRWLGYQRQQRNIPYFKIGHLVWYDPVLVRRAIEERCQIKAR